MLSFHPIWIALIALFQSLLLKIRSCGSLQLIHWKITDKTICFAEKWDTMFLLLLGLHFRKENSCSLRAQLGWIPWEVSMESKGVSKCWGFLKNSLLETQKQFSPFKGKGSRWSKKPPCLICDPLSAETDQNKKRSKPEMVKRMNWELRWCCQRVQRWSKKSKNTAQIEVGQWTLCCCGKEHQHGVVNRDTASRAKEVIFQLHSALFRP